MEIQIGEADNFGNVVVLLSSYNGGKYIAEQIQSIIQQDYLGNIEILIRDDGSTDDTVLILKSISYPKNRKIKILEEPGLLLQNLGPQRSFLKLIESASTADYYFLADQDDVWRSNHISSAVDILEGKSGPVLYCANYSLANAELQVVKESVVVSKPQFTPLKAFFYNKIPGCCMAWNQDLQSYICQMHPKNVMMHDRYIASFACFVGKVIYDPQSHILHRIHDNNVIGTGNKKIEIMSWIREKINLLIKEEDYDVCEMAKEFLRVGGNVAHPEFVKDIELLRDYRDNRSKTIELLRHPDTYDDNGNTRNQMSIRSKIIFRLF